MLKGKKFISLGIKYNDNEMKKPLNRRIYNDTNFPPTKPISGGFWGSTYILGERYKSEWEKYVMEVLDSKLFKEKLTGNDTIFEVDNEAKILVLNKIDDVWIEFKGDNVQSNLVLRQIKVSGDVPPEYKNHLYIDFSGMCEYYDAMYVSSEFAHKVDWILNEFKRRVLLGIPEFNEELTLEMLYVAEMFEDWNVDSMLVLNKNAIKVVE